MRRSSHHKDDEASGDAIDHQYGTSHTAKSHHQESKSKRRDSTRVTPRNSKHILSGFHPTQAFINLLSQFLWGMVVLFVWMLKWSLLVWVALLFYFALGIHVRPTSQRLSTDEVRLGDYDWLYDVQSKLAGVQQLSLRNTVSPSAFKHGESALQDIRAAVSRGTIAGSEGTARHVNDFIALARITLPKLTRYYNDIKHTADATLVINYSVQRELKNAESKPGFSFSRMFDPAFLFVSRPTTMAAVQNIFIRYTKDLRNELSSIILQGQSLCAELHSLQNILDSIVRSMGLKLKLESRWNDDLDHFRVVIPQQHRDQIRPLERQIQSLVGLMSNLTRASHLTNGATDALSSISKDIRPLQLALDRPEAELALTDSDIAYSISQVGTVIDAIESGKKAIKQRSKG